jgi:hypothetical protein
MTRPQEIKEGQLKTSIGTPNRVGHRPHTPGEIASQGLGNFSAEMVRGVEVKKKFASSKSCSAT